MSKKKVIVQISDTHLFGDTNKELNGANSYLNLSKVLSYIQAELEKVDLIICTGDLSQDCTPDSYKHLANLLNVTDINYHLIPGNHDDVDMINKVFDFTWLKNNVDYSFDLENWFFYFIDSSEYPKEGGYVTPDQLSNFSNALKNNQNKSTVVFLHHHPLKINSSWMDKMLLNSSNEFNEIIENNSQVKAVLFGHIHQVFEKVLGKTLYASAPSTSFQVKSNAETFLLDKLIPGFRLIELDGENFNSKVVWVD